ncbi:hypothetical protein SAMN04489732_102389 [Amycolatopsis saalfeldensis]|uniref:Uncharacterized protein n=1 Tax=Amycolatopsis saalfeldensis TaxID=394193 RepID=A0A1H8T1E1_9PSEU|nr:hypothetical protein SAMN04489732_102389 [Amycolatopsis saalfeldensis]
MSAAAATVRAGDRDELRIDPDTTVAPSRDREGATVGSAGYGFAH